MDPTDISDQLATAWGQAVRKQREARGLSQSTLAKACDTSQQAIAKIERGKLIPRDRLKVILAARLGLPVEELFTWPRDLTMGAS